MELSKFNHISTVHCRVVAPSEDTQLAAAATAG
jgi:hypothetical protein